MYNRIMSYVWAVVAGFGLAAGADSSFLFYWMFLGIMFALWSIADSISEEN